MKLQLLQQYTLHSKWTLPPGAVIERADDQETRDLIAAGVMKEVDPNTATKIVNSELYDGCLPPAPEVLVAAGERKKAKPAAEAE